MDRTNAAAAVLTQEQMMMENEAAALAAEMFDHFCSATTIRQILGLYRNMCDTIGLRPGPLNEFYPKLKHKIKNWKAQALWKKFDARASHRVYNKGTACNGMRVFVIGAGPCGLRTAIEAQLLGAKVVVVEKRDRISRNNVLHLWPFLITDLRNLGAKKFYGKFCAGAIDHISIRQLQCILLKVALLLGVEIHEGISFEETIPPTDGCGWRARVSPEDHAVSHYEFDVLIGADGKRNTLEGFRRKEFRGKLAIAITANFINKKTEAEARVEEISGVAFIFNQGFFKDLYQTTGIDLENIVYYKDDTHYFVMTAKKHSLLDKGVIMHDYADPAELLNSSNVNTARLYDYAKEAADYATKYQLPNLEFAVNHYGKPDVAMFDFTSMFAAENSSRIAVRKNYRLLQCLVGDSLLEPFWPTGSGCARGFLSSMDAAYAIKLFSNSKNSSLGVMAQRESIYRLLAQTTPENLHRDIGSYTIEPSTRYPNLNRTAVTPIQVKNYLDTDDPAVYEQIFMDTTALTALAIDEPIRRKRRTADTIPLGVVLLRWIKSQLKIYEFCGTLTEESQIFIQGQVLVHLIHRYRPDLIDLTDLAGKTPQELNDHAFNILENDLAIPRVMTAAESVNLDKVDSKIWLNYLEQICEVFRGEIPHVKHPKLDFNELRDKPRNVPSSMADFSRLYKKYSTGVKKLEATTTQQQPAAAPIAANRRPSRDEEHHRTRRPRKLTETKVDPVAGQNDTPRRAKKRRSYDKNIEERTKRLQEIEENRFDRQSKRREQRRRQTENFLTSLHMLQANQFLRESDSSTPFEDYSLFVYRQSAPIFNDRVKDLEQKLLYPDRERGIPSALPRGGLDDQFSDRIKSMEQRITGKHGGFTEKKPKDLLRAIGKIESNDWNVKEIEKKIEASKKTEVGKSREKVPKWSREQFLARQNKMSRPIDKEAGDEKYREIDTTIKALDKQLKDPVLLERGKNKVAAIAGQFVKKDAVDATASTASDEKSSHQKPNQTKAAPVFSSHTASDICHFCKQRVYLMEKVTAESLILHRSCLKCHHCHTNLRLGGYAFDRDNPHGLFYCTQHYRLPAKAKPTPKRLMPRPSTTHKTAQDASRKPDMPSILSDAAKSELSKMDVFNRGQTPERIEFENVDISDGEPSLEHVIDENEWTDRNFGTGTDASESDITSSTSESEDSDSDIFEEAMGSPLGAQTLQLATDWIGKQRYIQDSDENDFYDTSEDDEADTQTEGEELAKARELRMQEVKLRPPLCAQMTDTETEVVSRKTSDVIATMAMPQQQVVPVASAPASPSIYTKVELNRIQNSDGNNLLNEDLNAINEKIYSMHNFINVNKEIEAMKKENIVKDDIKRKLSMKEQWLRSNSSGAGSLSGSSESLGSCLRSGWSSRESLRGSRGGLNMAGGGSHSGSLAGLTALSKPDGLDIVGSEVLASVDSVGPSSLSGSQTGLNLAKDSSPLGIQTALISAHGGGSLTGLSSADSESKSALGTNANIAAANSHTGSQISLNSTSNFGSQSAISGSKSGVGTNAIIAAENSNIGSQKSLNSGSQSAINLVTDIDEILDCLDIKEEEPPNMFKKMKEIEAKSFSETLDAIKNQVPTVKVATDQTKDLSKFFATPKENKKEVEVASSKNAKEKKELDLAKYFPESPAPQRKMSATRPPMAKDPALPMPPKLPARNKLDRPKKVQAPQPPKQVVKKMETSSDEIDMFDQLLDGAIDIKPGAKIKKIVDKPMKRAPLRLSLPVKKLDGDNDESSLFDRILKENASAIMKSPSVDYSKLFGALEIDIDADDFDRLIDDDCDVKISVDKPVAASQNGAAVPKKTKKVIVKKKKLVTKVVPKKVVPVPVPSPPVKVDKEYSVFFENIYEMLEKRMEEEKKSKALGCDSKEEAKEEKSWNLNLLGSKDDLTKLSTTVSSACSTMSSPMEEKCIEFAEFKNATDDNSFVESSEIVKMEIKYNDGLARSQSKDKDDDRILVKQKSRSKTKSRSQSAEIVECGESEITKASLLQIESYPAPYEIELRSTNECVQDKSRSQSQEFECLKKEISVYNPDSELRRSKTNSRSQSAEVPDTEISSRMRSKPNSRSQSKEIVEILSDTHEIPFDIVETKTTSRTQSRESSHSDLGLNRRIQLSSRSQSGETEIIASVINNNDNIIDVDITTKRPLFKRQQQISSEEPIYLEKEKQSTLDVENEFSKLFDDSLENVDNFDTMFNSTTEQESAVFDEMPLPMVPSERLSEQTPVEEPEIVLKRSWPPPQRNLSPLMKHHGRNSFDDTESNQEEVHFRKIQDIQQDLKKKDAKKTKPKAKSPPQVTKGIIATRAKKLVDRAADRGIDISLLSRDFIDLSRMSSYEEEDDKIVDKTVGSVVKQNVSETKAIRPVALPIKSKRSSPKEEVVVSPMKPKRSSSKENVTVSPSETIPANVTFVLPKPKVKVNNTENNVTVTIDTRRKSQSPLNIKPESVPIEVEQSITLPPKPKRKSIEDKQKSDNVSTVEIKQDLASNKNVEIPQSPVFPIKPQRRRHHNSSLSLSPDLNPKSVQLEDLHNRTEAVLQNPSPIQSRCDTVSSSDESQKTKPFYTDHHRFPRLEKLQSHDTLISSPSPEPKSSMSPEPPIDKGTSILLERSQELHLKKQEFMRERMAGNNPYLKRMLEREDRGISSSKSGSNSRSSSRPLDSHNKSMFGYFKRSQTPQRNKDISSQASTSSNKDTNCAASDTDSSSPDVELNSATEISTDSEFDLDPISKNPPQIYIDDSFVKKPTRVHIKQGMIGNGFSNNRFNVVESIANKKPIDKDIHLKFKPLVQVDPSVLNSNIAPLKNPRPGDYILNKTPSTEGIASKKSLELKKRYLLGDPNLTGGIMKSGSTSILDSKLRNFHSNISECQKLLNPGAAISPTMQSFLQKTNKIGESKNNNVDEKENIRNDENNKLTETVNTALIEHNIRNKPIEIIDLTISPEVKTKPIIDTINIPDTVIKKNQEFIENMEKSDIIDLTVDTPVKDRSLEEQNENFSAVVPDIIKSSNLMERTKNTIDQMFEENVNSTDKLENCEDVNDQRARSPAHETSIQVPTRISWEKNSIKNNIESDSLSSSSSTSSLDEIPHYILDSATSPETQGGAAGDNKFIPRVEVRDSAGELMQIDSLMIVNGKYVGDPDDLKLCEKLPEGTVVDETTTTSSALSQSTSTPPTSTTPTTPTPVILIKKREDKLLKKDEDRNDDDTKCDTNNKTSCLDSILKYDYNKPDLKFDTKNENKLDTLRNLPLIIPKEKKPPMQLKFAETSDDKRYSSDVDKTPTVANPEPTIQQKHLEEVSSKFLANSDSETEITGQGMTETELSDWTADDAVSENFVDIEFALNSNKGTIKRNKKHKTKKRATFVASNNTQAKTGDYISGGGDSGKFLDFDNIEFMDTGSEDSCIETYSTVNKAMLRNRGYVEFVDHHDDVKDYMQYKPDPGYAKDSASPKYQQPNNRTQMVEAVNKDLPKIDFIEQGACILSSDFDLKTPINEVPQMLGGKHHNGHPTDMEEDSLLMIASQTTTTTEDSDALTVVTSPLDSFPEKFDAFSSDSTKTEEKKIEIEKLLEKTINNNIADHKDINKTPEDMSYEEYVRQLQTQIREISSARDSLDMRKSRRKSSKGDDISAPISQINTATTSPSKSLSIFQTSPSAPTVTKKLEEITKERTKQKDLIHDLVMDKLQTKKQLNAEKRLNRSRNRNNVIFSAMHVSHNPHGNETCDLHPIAPDRRNSKSKETSAERRHSLNVSPADSKETTMRPLSAHVGIIATPKITKTQSFCISNTTNYRSPFSEFRTPIAPPRTKNADPVTDKIRSEARERARLKSNEDLGLSPEDKIQLLRKRYHLDMMQVNKVPDPMKNKSDDMKFRERRLISSKSVNDITTVHQLASELRKSYIGTTSSPLSTPQTPKYNKNFEFSTSEYDLKKSQKDRRGLIQTVSDFFYKKKDSKDSSPTKDNKDAADVKVRFGLFRMSPRSKSKSFSDMRTLGDGEKETNISPNERSKSENSIKHDKQSATTSSSPDKFDDVAPPPIPPLPLNYQRSDDENYSFNDSRESRKCRSLSKASRQAELKRLRIAQEIQREQEEIEVKIKELEASGVALEKALRGEGQDFELSDSKNDENFVKDLLEIWRNITDLRKRDEELEIRQKELQLEHRHAQLKEELNVRLSCNKLDKSSSDIAAEGAILNEMLEIVAKRAALRPADSIGTTDTNHDTDI